MVLPAAPDLLQLETGIAASLEDAGRTLLSMASAGAVPASLRRLMPPGFIEAAIEAHGSIAPRDRPPTPTQREVADMAEALSWVALLDDLRLRRVVLLRALVHPATGRPFFGARRAARIFHVHSDTVAAWHRRAVRIIAGQLHQRAGVAD